MSYSYNIHDIIKMESFAELYELNYFKTPGIKEDLDLYVGEDVSSPNYQELLCSVWIDPGKNGDNTYLGVSKLLNWSRHVLYVNLVEPLLRLMLVPKGYALLHLACLEKNGEGIMISAPPDTGKTSCILKCLKNNNENGSELSLLSDDMVIVSKNGYLLPYPKPFTISSHTLDSVFGIDTNLWYKVRSRVHSKGGRSTYKGIGTIPFMPIMSINAMAQIIFEPPKLYPDKIVSIKIGKIAAPKRLFFLSTEFIGEKEISKEEALQNILSNTDNAYITPPYDKIFPKLEINGVSYDNIIKEEIDIAKNIIERTEPMIIGRKDYSWYDYIINN